MALIKCPECGKEISDKSKSCIHCGYPLNDAHISKPKQYCIVLLSFDKGKKLSMYAVLHRIDASMTPKDVDRVYDALPYVLKTNISYDEALDFKRDFYLIGADAEIKEMNGESVSLEDIRRTPLKTFCPKCKSTQVTTGARGFSFVTGFIGSDKTVNRCSKCGYKWTPRF